MFPIDSVSLKNSEEGTLPRPHCQQATEKEIPPRSVSRP